MDRMKDLPYLKNSSPTMIRRLRASFFAFCLLTLCLSTFLLWDYGATLPHAFHGFEDADEIVQGGISTTDSASATVTNSAVVSTTTSLSSNLGLDQSGSTHLPYFDLVWWLKSFGRVPGRPLVFMIASNEDMAITFNMLENLKQIDRSEDFIVLCLQKACLQAPEVYTFDVSGMHRISVKIAASIQLLYAGFSFVFLEPDVYLTNAVDPFTGMQSLDEESWDIQFFPGKEKGEKGFDTSLYFARPGNYTMEFFKKVQSLWTETGDQDINSLMNIVGFEMRDGTGTLRLKILSHKTFVSWEDNMDWETKNFNNKMAINTLQKQSSAYHMTCVEPSLRTYMARNYGAWFDVGSYYSGKRKFLGIKGLEGDVVHVTRIVGFAAKVAIDTGRVLIFPSSAIVTQARKNAATGASDYVTIPEFPAYRLVDPTSLEKLSLHVVESMYLNNRARYSDDAPSQETIIMGNGHSVKDPKDGKPVVVATIKAMTETEVVWLDMGSGRWWDLDASGAMAEYTKEVLSTIRSCANANEEKFECNKRCT